MSDWLPAIVTGAGSLVSGAASLFGASNTNRTNRKIAQETNAANAQLQKDQNAYNLEMWQRNNEYNSPEQQVLRLKQAGLNPL